MPNAATTQASSASDATGTPVPLSYGYVWATGKRAEYFQLLDIDAPNDMFLNYSRLGIWLLGEGEWDGCTELWINDALVWRGSTPTQVGFYEMNETICLDNAGQPMVFNFHSGTDAVIGSGLAPTSYGPDQNVDITFALYPPAIQPLHYSRVAYYAVLRKQPIENQTSTNQRDPSQWTDINPIGLWRALRCRLFDANGNMTGYAFTTNPAWHWVDARLRRKLFPEYALTLTGPDDLTAQVRACFDWNKIYTSAQYFDEILANGRRRFQGSYSFTQGTSLQAIESQILLCCRSYLSSYGGQYAINCDMPRATSFTFTREHVLPGTFEATDQSIHTAGNRYVANFRDLLVPACNVIASIACPSNGNPVVTTTLPHPFNAGDWVSIGGTNTTFDGEWLVDSVPAIVDAGTPEEVDPTQLTLLRKGSSYPASVGAVGASIGLLYSRFKERAPEFWHKANMLARGAVGNGVRRVRNKVKLSLDFATSTYDQASRIARYERDRALGADVTGANGQLDGAYVTPPFIKLRTSMFARDASGNLACGIEPGDHVTVDRTLSATYAGEYEVLDPKEVHPPSAEAAGRGDSLTLLPSSASGELGFALGPYNEDILYDTSDPLQAGWPSVPGSDPGNDEIYTAIPLDGGGDFVFFAGLSNSGEQFQLPSTGYPTANMLAWASAAGASIQYHSAQAIDICAVSSTRALQLTYDDTEGTTWGGAMGYAALTWLGAGAAASTVGAFGWTTLTLPGGEIVAFGQGLLADGAVITDAMLPAGFDVSKMFALAFIENIPGDGGNVMHSAGATVDGSNTVQVDMSDGEGHTWHGTASVLLFCWQNNMGSITTETVDGASWIECVLSNGMKFGAGVSKGLANGATLGVPSAAGEATTLEVIAGSSYGGAIAGSNHAQGVGACYVDADNIVHIMFQDGSGDQWYGQADVFGLYCEAGVAGPTIVSVSPPSVTLAAAATQQFTAAVSGNANPNVVWSVDGIVGGNLTVGTINSTGFYAAPNAAGNHTITAKSVGDPTANGTAAVSIFGDILTGDVLTDDAGNVIYDASGNTIAPD